MNSDAVAGMPAPRQWDGGMSTGLTMEPLVPRVAKSTTAPSASSNNTERSVEPGNQLTPVPVNRLGHTPGERPNSVTVNNALDCRRLPAGMVTLEMGATGVSYIRTRQPETSTGRPETFMNSTASTPMSISVMSTGLAGNKSVVPMAFKRTLPLNWVTGSLLRSTARTRTGKETPGDCVVGTGSHAKWCRLARPVPVSATLSTAPVQATDSTVSVAARGPLRVGWNTTPKARVPPGNTMGGPVSEVTRKSLVSPAESLTRTESRLEGPRFVTAKNC